MRTFLSVLRRLEHYARVVVSPKNRHENAQGAAIFVTGSALLVLGLWLVRFF